MRYTNQQWLWALLRLGMGWIFIFPFFDKLLGLGHETAANKAWMLGNSPAYGFLAHASKGPFASFYQGIAGNAFVDWIFMIGLILIGLALISGIGIKIAAYSGSLMLFLMWTAVLPPANDIFLDYHLIYPLVLMLLASVKSGRFFGFGIWWAKTRLVKKYPILE